MQDVFYENELRSFFLITDRIGFSNWSETDSDLAHQLWGNPDVTKYICASGAFSRAEIGNRLGTEMQNEELYGVQYWPIFHRETSAFIGCCGLRPRSENVYEIGFHLCPEFWGQGYAVEAANAVISYAFTVLKAERLFAGHNPKNIASQKVLKKLGFTYVGDEYYAPTGLHHPSYELKKNKE